MLYKIKNFIFDDAENGNLLARKISIVSLIMGSLIFLSLFSYNNGMSEFRFLFLLIILGLNIIILFFLFCSIFIYRNLQYWRIFLKTFFIVSVVTSLIYSSMPFALEAAGLIEKMG